ncbi:hypothetical protein [Niveispirillum fermenti]|uniref:hypothetical protein n=1 Tax=Niveispirillum fermenti TaxID=1233113 RepID=UPI003A883165
MQEICRDFDRFVGIDWSGREKNYKGVTVAHCGQDSIVHPAVAVAGHWRREAVAYWIAERVARGERLLVGFDFGFSLPWLEGVGYLDGRTDQDHMFDLWNLVHVAANGAADDFGGAAVSHPLFQPSYWIRGTRPAHWGDGTGKRRQTEIAAAAGGLGRPESLFKLIGSKQVGKASLAGMLTLRRLRNLLGDRLAVWPAQTPGPDQSVIVEVFPTLFRKQVNGNVNKIREKAELERCLAPFGCRLAWNDLLDYNDDLGDAIITAAGLSRLAAKPGVWNPSGMTAETARREGWIFGVGA